MIKILFFAQLREQLGCSEYQLQVNASMSIEALRQQLVQQKSEWHEFFASDKLLTAVNQELVDSKAMVSDGDEVAFFPPVTGG